MKSAVNITSSLLKDIHKVQAGEIRTNILVHLDKLEKFAFNYAKLHVRSEMNNSAREISFGDEEIGKILNSYVCGVIESMMLVGFF